MIRHAEAEGNIYRRAHGQFNGQIIGRGFSQIEQLRERFLNEKIDAVYSSDLDRTVATAAALSEPRGLPVNTTQDLREVKMGEWEDIAWGDIRHDSLAMAELFGCDPARWNNAGSEDYGRVRERMINCLRDIGRRHEGGAVAVFSHGFAIRALTCELMGIPSNKTDLVPYCDNTAVALLLFEDGKFTIEYQRDNSHLQNGASTFARQTWWRDKKEYKSEDLRYMPADDKRDADILEMCLREETCSNEKCSVPNTDFKLAAFLEDVPTGILGMDIDRDGGDGIGWISQIYIKPELRRMYYGVQLLGQAVSVYRKKHRERLRLEAAADSPAIHFCDKYGFIKISEKRSLCVMEKNIRNW